MGVILWVELRASCRNFRISRRPAASHKAEQSRPSSSLSLSLSACAETSSLLLPLSSPGRSCICAPWEDYKELLCEGMQLLKFDEIQLKREGSRWVNNTTPPFPEYQAAELCLPPPPLTHTHTHTTRTHKHPQRTATPPQRTHTRTNKHYTMSKYKHSNTHKAARREYAHVRRTASVEMLPTQTSVHHWNHSCGGSVLAEVRKATNNNCDNTNTALNCRLASPRPRASALFLILGFYYRSSRGVFCQALRKFGREQPRCTKGTSVRRPSSGFAAAQRESGRRRREERH